MSLTLLNFTKAYLNERLDTPSFVNTYIELWRIEQDLGICHQDDKKLSLLLSSIFCLVDLYYPEDDKAEFELNDSELFAKISEELKLFEHQG